VLSCAIGQLNLDRKNLVTALRAFALAQNRLRRIPASAIHVHPLEITLGAPHFSTSCF
jgi:hypothetical protein